MSGKICPLKYNCNTMVGLQNGNCPNQQSCEEAQDNIDYHNCQDRDFVFELYTDEEDDYYGGPYDPFEEESPCLFHPPDLNTEYSDENGIYYKIVKVKRMIVLKSSYFLIGDIDCKEQNKPEYLEKIDNYVHNNDVTFSIYETKNGLRFIQLDRIYQGVDRNAIELLRTLDNDPKYIELCTKGNYFAARLTPKVKDFEQYFNTLQVGGSMPVSVARNLEFYPGKKASMATDLVDVHDYYCQSFLYPHLPLS